MMPEMPSPVPVLYSFRRCPYAMRARLALMASGHCVELREIVLKDKAPELLAASAKATVPVLVLEDGTVIDESFEIMLWALRCCDPEQWLTPPAADASLDEMMELIAECDGDFKRHLDAYKYASRDTPEKGHVARSEGAQFLLRLDQRLADQPWLLGDRASLADMAIFPFVRQFAFVDRAWFDVQPWGDLRAWLDGLLESDRFATVMQKFAKWEAGHAPIYFNELSREKVG